MNIEKNEIDNQNVPDKFIEITSLLRLHKKEIRKKMLKILNNKFVEDDDIKNKFIEIIEYAVFSSEKYYRSFFTRQIGDALCIEQPKSIFIGAIIEIVYSYVMIQNSIPEIENDDFINGRISCHRKFGNAATIITANSLLPLIFETLSTENCAKLNNENRCKVIEIIAKYSGKDGICCGQMMKIMLKRRKSYQDELTRLHQLKIAALFNAGAECMVAISQCNENVKNAVKNYTTNFCTILSIFDRISKVDSDLELLSQAKLLSEQAIQSAKIIDKNNTTQLINFIEYNYYCVETLATKNAPLTVASRVGLVGDAACV